MASHVDGAFPQKNDHLHIWDSQYGSKAEAFSLFRETICTAFMPWTPEFYGRDFAGRVESVALANGAIGRVRMSPIVAIKTKSNISQSPIDCIHGNLIISGELKVDQGDTSNIAKRGDLVLYESFSPVTLTERPDAPCDNLAFIIPTSAFPKAQDVDHKFSNVLIPSEKLVGPLAGCLTMLAQTLCTAPAEELAALFQACISLLPMSVGFIECDRQPNIPKNYLLARLLDYIDHNLSDPELSPPHVAEQFGISVRYLHKLFVQFGTTFSAHVTTERLKRIKWDLEVSSGRRPSISALAYRWGFNDLSTFHRAFKKQFGCTPSNAHYQELVRTSTKSSVERGDAPRCELRYSG
ncbi:AraC family transcriptional regulator [Hyphomicrobium sp. DY-1]|uniref:AraC family transcriptional regulator n=1 Tax=Hyphomicrobium sp. DY-1 TaxID=3075650 RepID=UPI0039C41C74